MTIFKNKDDLFKKISFLKGVGPKLTKYLRNKRIENIIEIQQEANINLATKIASKYNARTVVILNKKPKLDAPMEYFK